MLLPRVGEPNAEKGKAWDGGAGAESTSAGMEGCGLLCRRGGRVRERGAFLRGSEGQAYPAGTVVVRAGRAYT